MEHAASPTRRCRRWPTAGGTVYAGKTIIHLKTRRWTSPTTPTGSAVTTRPTSPWPGNGVLYVKNNGACNGEIPTDADYDEADSCGNVYVSGTYSKLAHDRRRQRRDHPPDDRREAHRELQRRQHHAQTTARDAMLGLIANNFVRVGHKVIREHGDCTATTTPPTSRRSRNVRIDAAIMSLLHSFIVDNYDCGKLRHADRQRRDRAEVPRPGRHRSRRHDLDRLPEGLLVRRPPALPLAAVLPEPARRRRGKSSELPGAGPAR